VKEFRPTYEYEFDPTAANDTAASVYRFAREGGKRVLDLGSGPAIVSSHLKRADAKEVTCVDDSADRLAVARQRGVDRVVRADLETSEWADSFPGETFDVVILADVLEHLRAPEAPLRLIRERKLLADGGYLVVSIPNIAHEAVAAELLTGRFRYRDAGLLDSTHVHFFTHDTFVDLMEREGFVITRLHRTLIPMERTEMASAAADLPAGVREQLASMPEGRTYQFVARVEPANEARELGLLRERLGSLEEDRDRLTGEAELLKVRMNDDAERLRRQITKLGEENKALTRRIERVYASRTWKLARSIAGAGRAVAHPLRTMEERKNRRAAMDAVKNLESETDR
jgi:2-polyprenyl-3-methyl-5-hydroxy-6-metoxy-1,4-benzoquinol methylase